MKIVINRGIAYQMKNCVLIIDEKIIQEDDQIKPDLQLNSE